MTQITHPPAKEALRLLKIMLTDEQLREKALQRHMEVMEDAIRTQNVHDSGKKEGRAQMLLQQLAHKFGPLSPATQQRVSAAGVSALDAWALNLLDAKTLDEVFAANPPAP